MHIPIKLGLGPSITHIGGVNSPVYGLQINAATVIDQKFLDEHPDKIPNGLRSKVKSFGTIEVGHILIPRTIYVSPTSTLQAYGATWALAGLRVGLLKNPFKLTLGADLLLTYLHLSTLLGTANFIRPGIGPKAEIEVPLSKAVSLGGGHGYSLYIPQSTAMGSIWNVSQVFFTVNFRFLQKVK